MNNLNRNVTALFDAVLEHVTPDFPGAFIGGGAIRDALHGKKWKDIDVFTWAPIPASLVAEPDDLNPFAPDDTIAAAAKEPVDSEGSPRISNVRKPIIFCGNFVQVIQLASDRYTPGDVQSVVNQFSIGLCQCGYTLYAGVPYLTEGYAIDQALHRFTVRECESLWEMQRALRKVASLASKYPDHELVVPNKHLSIFTLL